MKIGLGELRKKPGTLGEPLVEGGVDRAQACRTCGRGTGGKSGYYMGQKKGLSGVVRRVKSQEIKNNDTQNHVHSKVGTCSKIKFGGGGHGHNVDIQQNHTKGKEKYAINTNWSGAKITKIRFPDSQGKKKGKNFYGK